MVAPAMGYDIHPIYGVERTVIAAVGTPTLDEGLVVEQVEAIVADGLLVEVHPNPEKALKDGAQSVTIPTFESMMGELKKMADAVGRDF